MFSDLSGDFCDRFSGDFVKTHGTELYFHHISAFMSTNVGQMHFFLAKHNQFVV
jgi:hypothetical protein